MELNKANDPNNMSEFEKKHTPIIEISGDKVIVKVGEIAHPMEEDHYISQIELFKDNEPIEKKELKPGDKPQAEFENVPLGNLKAQSLCNLHGLWESI
jgi:superoxide reductase